jgi:uncharacterized hydrophobic protein (TIGR00271 family)
MRSPFEVFQEGIQSIGAVQGLLGYAILGGIVVWVGLYTNAVSLLVAAMLIAPFAGPAMNFALGTARGDTRLMGRSFLRYVGSVTATVVTALLTSLAIGPQEATQAMMDNSKISEIVVFLPLVAGAAGALNLIQSQRDSLVSGAAVGVLVAAALAPPAGNLGMFIALGQKLPALNCLFILALQLVAINLSGALVFRWHGVNAEQALYQRGKSWISNMALLGSVLALAGLLYLQLQDTPSLRRSSLEQQFSARITQNLKDSDLVYPLEAQVDFLPTKKRFEHTILLQVKCLKLTDEPDSEIEPLVKEMIRASVQQQLPDSDPLISLELIKKG